MAFIKTSSSYGFVKQPSGDYNYKGATEHVLTPMRQHSAPEVQVKAAAGVHTATPGPKGTRPYSGSTTP